MSSWKLKVVNLYDCEVKFYISLKQAVRYISSVKCGEVYLYVPQDGYGDYCGCWQVAWMVKNGVMLNKDGEKYYG